MKGSKARDIPVLLESIYDEYHKPEFIHPDPLEFLFRYDEIFDREIVGLIASSLAIGRVSAILDVVGSILDKLPSPRKNLEEMVLDDFYRLFGDFKYRFYNPESLAFFLLGIKQVIGKYGSLNNCFISGVKQEQGGGIVSALSFFAGELKKWDSSSVNILPNPEKGSACKRLNLFLRWMVRQDEIDPGGWTGISPASLLVPLDTHMHRIGLMLGFTERKSADINSAVEITESLKKYDPEDPVRFDFSLTRLGIHPDLDYGRLS